LKIQFDSLFDPAFCFFFLSHPGHAISTQILQQEFGVTRGTVDVIFSLIFFFGRYTIILSEGGFFWQDLNIAHTDKIVQATSRAEWKVSALTSHKTNSVYIFNDNFTMLSNVLNHQGQR